MSEAVLCNSCKWFKRRDWLLFGSRSGEFDQCTNTALAMDDEKAMTLVHGGKLEHRGYCSIERGFGCGPEGKLYERK